MGPVLAKLRLHPFLRILAVPTRTVVQGGEAIGGGITRFLGSTWRTFHTSRLFTLISGSPGSTRLSQLMRGLQAVGSSFGRGASRLGTGFTSVASGLRRIRPWTGWSSWGTALTNTANQLREGLALRFWKERGWGRGKPASAHGPQRGDGYASAQWTPTVGRNPGMKPQALGQSRVTATGISFRTVSSVLPDPDYSPSVDPQLLALLERYNQEDSQEKALISSLKLYLSQLGLLHGEEYIDGQGYSDQYTPELYNAIKDLQLLLNVFGDDLLLREEGRYHLEVNGEMDQDLVDMARTLASQGYPLGDWLTLLQDPDYQAEKWQAYEAYLQANGWDVLQIKEFLRITGFLQVEGELTAHYDLDTHAALLRFLQAHNEESSFGEMVQWDGISLIPLVLLEHLKKKGAGNRLYYGKHKKGIWDFIVGFMLGFTKGAVSLTAGFAIFAGGTLKFLFNMVFRPFKTGKEAFEALCRIPGAIVNLFKAIKVAYQEKVINGNLFTMGEFFGWATFEGTAIVIPIGIAKELSLLARFENWLIRLRLPQKGILGLLTHGTRNVAVYAVRGMRMVEQKINQGIRFVVLRVTILLRTMWGKIKGNFERVTEYLRNLASSIAQKRGKYTNAYIEANFKSFVSEIDAHLAETGLSKEEFISLIHKNVEDLTEAEIAILQQVRESISMPNEETLMQKVVTIDQLNNYLSGEWKPIISGYVTRAQDTVHLKTYNEVREGLRLDYTNNNGYIPYPDGGNEYGIIRFKTDLEIEIPRTKEFDGNEEIWTNDYGRQPFTGNGFTKSENTIIPEYLIQNSIKKAPLEAELYRVIDGELQLVAVIKNSKLILVQ